MNRNLFSLVGILIAVFSFTFGGTDAEARNCGGRQRNRGCQQIDNCGSQQFGYSGHRQGRNCGNGCAQTGQYGYQQAYRSGFEQSGNNCCQQMSYSSYQQQTSNWRSGNACCTAQPGVIQSGFENGQPGVVTPASGVDTAPPIEPVQPTALAPAN